MNLNDAVFELDGESGNFGWFVKRYIEKLVEEKFTSTNNARDEICPTCGGHGHVWSAFNEILYCRKCSGTGKLSPVA